jgi:hypothetical protein
MSRIIVGPDSDPTLPIYCQECNTTLSNLKSFRNHCYRKHKNEKMSLDVVESSVKIAPEATTTAITITEPTTTTTSAPEKNIPIPESEANGNDKEAAPENDLSPSNSNEKMESLVLEALRENPVADLSKISAQPQKTVYFRDVTKFDGGSDVPTAARARFQLPPPIWTPTAPIAARKAIATVPLPPTTTLYPDAPLDSVIIPVKTAADKALEIRLRAKFISELPPPNGDVDIARDRRNSYKNIAKRLLPATTDFRERKESLATFLNTEQAACERVLSFCFQEIGRYSVENDIRSETQKAKKARKNEDADETGQGKK